MPLDLNEHTGILIRNVHLSIMSYVKKQLKPFNLAPEQNLIMMMLWKQDGISPNRFVSELQKDKANIARMIASLEKKGFIQKFDDPCDKRTFKVYLTDEGKRLESCVLPILKEAHQTLMDGITDEQFSEVQNVLTKMMSNISGGTKS